MNIGWLSRDHAYPVGDPPEGLVPVLGELIKNPSNVYRGMHFCELCPSFEVAKETTSWNGYFVGSGEIRVPGLGGIVYVAPVMVVHYVADHHYLPPLEFRQAANPSSILEI
uniref:DUF7919 family protein n=1 Tax=Streptomyces odontomachi TaxID=2944940 RepID=UPI00210D9FE1|nr:hypothetical protein [Streptomyces sp. ODS25]